MSTLPSHLSVPSHQLFSQWRPVYRNPEIGGGSSFRVLPENFFSGKENVSEFLNSIDYGVMFHEIPANLACAYLKGHLIGKARYWFEVMGSSYVTGTATDFAQLKQALTNSFPVVRNRSEIEAEFYSSHHFRSQAPSDFVYKLLKIQKVLNFEMTEENLVNNIIMRLSPQVGIYHPRERDENVVETDELDGEGSRAEQVETEGSNGLSQEESSKKEKWQIKRTMSEESIEFSNNYEREYQRKRRPPEIKLAKTQCAFFIRSRNKKDDKVRSS
ncbi:uncharacterized protein NPIL_469161 [Nephila pilipes]|uniref:Retrotransposon gag domain-containing protein n=1 Tax=Nephila pilipes TaxID=299642 RepID=A0A8X6Q5U2_NEPPI|nr:uncharacterized protein NPIL_469161 [Nephila pilipes]